MKKLIALFLLGSFVLMVETSYGYPAFKHDNSHQVLKTVEPAIMNFDVPVIVRPLTEVLIIPVEDVLIGKAYRLIDPYANSPPGNIRRKG